MNDPTDPKSPFGGSLDIPDLDTSEAGRRHSGRAPAPGPSRAPAAQPSRAPNGPPRAPAPVEEDPFDALSEGVTLGSSMAPDPVGAGFDSNHFDGDLQQPSGAYAGDGFGDLDDDVPVGNLDLASYRPPAAARGAPAGGAPWPTGESPNRSFLQIDALEIAQVAGYGAVPAGPHLAPMYAWRVFQRQRELRRQLGQIDAQLSSAEARRDEMLASRAEAMRARLDGDSRYTTVLAPLRELDQVAAERGQELAQTSQQYEQYSAQVADQHAQLDQQIADRSGPLENARRAHQDAEVEFKRVDARSKRFLIEIRNLKHAAAGPAPNAPLPPEAAAQVQALESQAQALAPELGQRRAAVAQAQAGLAELEKEIATLHEAKKRLDTQQKRNAAQIKKQLDQRAAGVQDATSRRRTALADAYRMVLANRDDPLDDATIATFKQADTDIERLTLESEKRLRALDAHDAKAVQTGRTIVIASVVALVVMIVILIAT